MDTYDPMANQPEQICKAGVSKKQDGQLLRNNTQAFDTLAKGLQIVYTWYVILWHLQKYRDHSSVSAYSAGLRGWLSYFFYLDLVPVMFLYVLYPY